MNAKSQSGNILIVLIVLALVGLVTVTGGYIILRQTVFKNQAFLMNQIEETEENRSLTDEYTETFSGTFMDVAASGKNIECAWTASSIEGREPLQGVLYAGNGMVRTEAKQELMEGMVIDAYMIFRDGMVYTWGKMNDTVAYGTKYPQEKMEVLSSDITPEMKAQAESFMAAYTYQCRPWGVDESLFSLPEDVIFQEI